MLVRFVMEGVFVGEFYILIDRIFKNLDIDFFEIGIYSLINYIKILIIGRVLDLNDYWFFLFW